MKRNKIILSVMAISLVFFLLIIVLVSTKIIAPELLLTRSFFAAIPIVTGAVVGAIFIFGYFYFVRSGKLQEKYKTLPVYGIAVILEAFGDMLNGKYAFIFMIVSTLLLVIAVTVDVRQKVGLYLFFKNNNETKGTS
jgi:hypothetical protein